MTSFSRATRLDSAAYPAGIARFVFGAEAANNDAMSVADRMTTNRGIFTDASSLRESVTVLKLFCLHFSTAIPFVEYRRPAQGEILRVRLKHCQQKYRSVCGIFVGPA
jgi:hypothetical protein